MSKVIYRDTETVFEVEGGGTRTTHWNNLPANAVVFANAVPVLVDPSNHLQEESEFEIIRTWRKLIYSRKNNPLTGKLETSIEHEFWYTLKNISTSRGKCSVRLGMILNE